MASLFELTDVELVDGLRELETRQRVTIAAIVEHLLEMDRRRLHLRLGYSSLYEYCQVALELSEDEAYRRVAATRMVAEFPEALGLLSKGRLTLTTLTMLKPHVTTDNAPEMFEMAAGLTKRELEKQLASLRPDSARNDVFARGRLRATGPEQWRLETTVGESTRSLLERALDLTSHTNPTRAFEPVLEQALRLLVEKLEREKRGKLAPARKAARSVDVEDTADVVAADGAAEVAAETVEVVAAAAKKVEVALSLPEPIDLTAPTQWMGRTAAASSAPARKARPAIPRPVRRAVFERDGERCAFVGRDGRQCECRRHLELDHFIPWELLREHTVGGLRVMCRAHNQLLAEDWFGRLRAG
ncbi:MAG TPA: HNH endonuclease signature motif containing protein [Polyangiaceae bacterium]|nr:HNH endonuclease signature motif containing protein [Polyangiaceae bacterium]